MGPAEPRQRARRLAASPDAESGVATPSDARSMRQLGYRLALIGTALMTREDPSLLLREIFDATRTVQP